MLKALNARSVQICLVKKLSLAILALPFLVLMNSLLRMDYALIVSMLKAVHLVSVIQEVAMSVNQACSLKKVDAILVHQ